LDTYDYQTYEPLIPALSTVYEAVSEELKGVQEIGKLVVVPEEKVGIAEISTPEDDNENHIKVLVTLTGAAGYVYGID